MPRSQPQHADLLAALAEVFREHGFEGASLSLIGKATGLGKGSLYHFFPGGKEEMAAAVLHHIDGWFEREIYAPLRQSHDPAMAIEAMFSATAAYFRSGQRVCLIGAFALADVRDRFAGAISSYFARWTAALTIPLLAIGHDEACAPMLAEEVVAGIQGAIVLSRALNDQSIFERTLGSLLQRSLNPRSGSGPPTVSSSA